MSRFEDEYVTVGTVRTRYWSMGHGGVPLVLLHGLGGTVADWGETIEALAKRRRVVAVDLLGNGGTDKPADCLYTPIEMRDHVNATLDALNLTQFDLNGWSLGGRVAISVAHATPDRVRRLILTAPAGIGPDTIVDFDAPYLDILRQLVTNPSESGWRILRNAIQSGSGGRLAKFAARRFTLASDAASRDAFLLQLRSFVGPSGYLEGPRLSVLNELVEISLPTLAIWGRQDHFAPFSHFDLLKEAMPEVELFVIEKCGHTPHIEWPDEYETAVDAFLD